MNNQITRPTTHEYLYGSDVHIPDAILDEDSTNGYLQIVVDDTGEIYMRGSRTLLREYIVQLQNTGILVSLDDIRWCG
jgi:hypothetical protein